MLIFNQSFKRYECVAGRGANYQTKKHLVEVRHDFVHLGFSAFGFTNTYSQSFVVSRRIGVYFPEQNSSREHAKNLANIKSRHLKILLSR